MTQKLDSAIFSKLQENKNVSKIISISSIGGGCINNSIKVNTNKGEFFVKTSHSSESLDMFKSEMESLKLINHHVPGFAITPITYGKLSESPGAFFISEFIHLEVIPRDKDKIFAQQLANLHIKSQFDTNGKFGFMIDTMCGSTRQNNTWNDNWMNFFTKQRIQVLLKKSGDKDIENMGKCICDQVIPTLLNIKVKPSLIHGDLWRGNCGWSQNMPIIFDSSSAYCHNEMELSIMKMFGGFSKDFFEYYHEYFPKLEPWYDERQNLYQLYHYLNHYVLFGGSYKEDCMRKMRYLIDWYRKQEK